MKSAPTDNSGMDAGDRSPPVSMIERVTAVLEAFRVDDTHLGVSELARRVGLPKSTVSRLVADLVTHRYLERDGSGLRLGLRLFELGERAAKPKELRSLALATMADLRDATGQTVHIAVLEGTEVVYIGILRGRNAPKLGSRVGGRLPAYATGMGKALLAFSSPEVVAGVIAKGLVQLQPRTITDPDVLLRELEQIRQTGIAYSREESGADVVCAASPILTLSKEPVASISVVGRVGLLDVQRVGPAVHTAALALGRNLPANAIYGVL